MMFHIVFTVWLSAITTTSAIIAFDCTDPSVNVSIVSINEVEECPEVPEEFEEISSRIQIIQRNQLTQAQVYSCVVEITRLITHCGMHSHSSLVKGGISNFVHPLGAEMCMNAHKFHAIKLFGNHLIAKLQSNSTTVVSLTLQGALNSDGSCSGGTYSEEGHTWNNVVVEASVKVQLFDYLTKVHLESGNIKLAGGTACVFNKGYCFDLISGEATWETQFDSSCASHYISIYQGAAKLIKVIKTHDLFVVVEESNNVFALSLGKRTNFCHYNAYFTEHPQLLVLNISLSETFWNSSPFHELSEINLNSYINSKFLYVEQSFKRSITTLYHDTISRRCELRREMLKNRLLLAPLSPNAVSSIIQSDKGYVGRVLGEVLYILKCIPKRVYVKKTEQCFNELPVKDNTNKSYYMAPITHVLQRHAEQVDCNHITPPMFKIDNEWIALMPYPIMKQAPAKLSIKQEKVMEFLPMGHLGSSGLYSQEDLQKVQNTITFGVERQAINNLVIRRIHGSEADGQGLDTTRLFSIKEAQRFAKDTLTYVWGWFTDIGMAVSGLIGFYMVFKVIKSLTSVIINGYALYNVIGCGFMIFASLWNSLTMLLLHKKKLNNRTRDAELGEQLDDVEPSPPSSSAITLPTVPRSTDVQPSMVHVYPNMEYLQPQQSSFQK